MSKTLIASLPFEIAARLPLQLGRDAIASSTAAITELIKNAYDANAENVRITFSNRDRPLSRLYIEDDGDGMDREQLETVWLKIGTENKSEASHSLRKNRVHTGAKGLGRLGIDRLCRKVILQTKTESMDHVLEVHINWSRYEKKNIAISDVTHQIYTIPLTQEFKHTDFFSNKSKGTRLILLGLREHWRDSRIDELQGELSLLVSPFSEINDFSIDLRRSIDDEAGLLTAEKVLEATSWIIDAQITAKHLVEGSFVHPSTGEMHKLEPEHWNRWLPDRGTTPQCGALSLKIFYIPQPGSEFSTSVARKDWKTTMERHHGIRIYRDQFRVRPYGEPTGRGDWLSLGLRKTASPGGIRQGGWRVGPRQIIGAVFISRLENSELIDQANREGMVETEGFFDLRAFTLKIIQHFESIATEHARRTTPRHDLDQINEELRDSISKGQIVVDNLHETIKQADLVSSDEGIKAQLLEMKQIIAATRVASERQHEEYKLRKDELEREKDTLANLASLGILTVCFGHEAQEFCNLAANAATELHERHAIGQFTVDPKIADLVSEDFQTIVDSTTFINNFAAFSLGNVSKEKRKKGNVHISAVIGRIQDALGESLDRQNIHFDITDISPDVYISKSYEIDWESIFVNMLSNSIWALTNIPKEHRIIKVGANYRDNNVEISFQDSGCGVEAGTEKHIFQPMFSTRRDHKGNVVGTGMGLSIVQTFVTEHLKGKIDLVPKGDLGGAQFFISVPR